MAKNSRGSVTLHRQRSGAESYRVRVTIDGVRRDLGLHPTRERGEAVLRAALEQVGEDSRGGMSLLAWGEAWLDRRETSGLHRAAAKDRDRWRMHVASADFAAWPMRRIARTDIVRWVRERLQREIQRAVTHGRGDARTVTYRPTGRRYSRQSIVLALGLLRRALQDAADEGHVPGCVAAGVSVPRVPRTTETWTYLTQAEIDRVLALPMRPAQLAAVTVAIYTGLRAGELWGLRWADVQLASERPELVIRHSYMGPTKSGKVRRVPLLEPARLALVAWRRERPGLPAALVFPSEGKRPEGRGGCHVDGYDAGWARLRERAQLGRHVRWHDLRHTCASHLVMGTWTPRPWRLEDVRQMLGHSTVAITERYAHLSPEGLAGLAREARDAGAIGHKLDIGRGE